VDYKFQYRHYTRAPEELAYPENNKCLQYSSPSQKSLIKWSLLSGLWWIWIC